MNYIKFLIIFYAFIAFYSCTHTKTSNEEDMISENNNNTDETQNILEDDSNSLEMTNNSNEDFTGNNFNEEEENNFLDDNINLNNVIDKNETINTKKNSKENKATSPEKEEIKNEKETNTAKEERKNTEEEDNYRKFVLHFGNLLGGHPEGIFFIIKDKTPVFNDHFEGSKIVGYMNRDRKVHAQRIINQIWVKIGKDQYIKRNHLRHGGIFTRGTELYRIKTSP